VDLNLGSNPAVQPGDVLYVDQLYPGIPRRIVSITPAATPLTYKIVVDKEFQAANGSGVYGTPPPPTGRYRSYSQSRPVRGEPVLQLPKDIAVDISRDAADNPTWHRMFPKLGNTKGTNPFDILFSASGQVVGREAQLGSRICLWVRDVALRDPCPATEL